MIGWLFSHRCNLSRVWTIQGRTYRVCLICGDEKDCSPEEAENWNATGSCVETFIGRLEEKFDESLR